MQHFGYGTMKKIILSLLMATPLISGAYAGNWNAGLRASTLGIAAEGGYHFNDTFGMRLQVTWWEHFKKKMEFDGVTYRDVRFRPVTVTLYADWYFYTKWWRLSLGGGYNGTKIRLNRDMSTAENPTHRHFGVVSGKYRYKNPLSYYVGTGFDFRKLGGSNWILTLDAGVYFMSKVGAKVTASGPLAQNEGAMKHLKRDAEELINDKKMLRTYPAISIGFKYEF